MDSEKLTILFPGVATSNPYHELLFTSLENNGIQPVQKSKPLFLPFTRIILSNPTIDVIHLDWLHYFYESDDVSDKKLINKTISFVRALFFCIDLLLVRIINIKIVWTIHNKRPHKEYYAGLENILNIFVGNTVNSISVKCHSAKRTISNSHRIHNTSKISIIPDGNYIDYYQNDICKRRARKCLNIDDEFVYMFFGRIQPYKGVTNLIDTFQSLSTTNEDCKLWIVGNPATDQLKNEIHSKSANDEDINIKLDFIPDDDVQYYLNAADVLVFPYNTILNSGSVHLGLSFAKPIIAPQLGCIPETVPPENTLLYDPSKEGALRDALIQAKSYDLKSIEEANYQHAISFDWDSIGKQYHKLYSNICKIK